MASVTVTLYGTLRRYLADGQGTVQIDLREPCAAGQLLERLGLPQGILSMLLLNGKQVALEAHVVEGDLLEAFPLIGGGDDR